MKKNFTAEIKFWKAMKICAIQGMLAMILCGMSVAHNNYAQLLDKKVTFSFQEVSLERALKEIGAVADVKFFYSIDQLDLEEKISFEAVDRTLREVLDELFGPYQIKYKVHEKKSTITLKKQAEESEPETSLPDEKITDKVAVTQELVATITGKVTDSETQQPMAGVNVIVKGTTEGTTTDTNGIFTIWAEDKDVLVFSFIGYVTFEAQVGGRTAIDVVLEQDVKNLKEVEVNAGYYSTTKEYQTGNISRVTAKEIQQQPVSNPLMALQGRMPGVQITQLTGVPGGNFTVRIRGTNSIANGNDPLYVIDGVPFTSNTLANALTTQEIYSLNGTNPLNGINPADIESIEVLKDADATAIYGSRGSNGVVLITTKRGTAGKTKVDINFYRGVGQTATKVDLLNTPQYLEMRDEAFATAGTVPIASDYDVNGTWSRDRYTDWQEVLIGGTAQMTDVQASIAGGEQNTQFSFGTGYHRETTVFPGDYADQRISSRLSLHNTSPNKKLETAASVTYSIINTDLIKTDLTKTALSLAPNAPALFDDNGNLNWENTTWGNPLAYTNTNIESQTSTMVGHATIGYKIITGLEIKASMGLTSMAMDAITLTPKTAGNPAFTTAPHRSYFSNSGFENWIIEPQMTYTCKIAQGVLTSLVGTSLLHQETTSIAHSSSGYASEALMKDIRAASTIVISNNNFSDYRYQSWFGRINYLYADKYIINATARRDGSSRFGPDQRFSNFGAIALGWIFTKERFVKNSVSFLSFGKFRASYGTTGNDQLLDYAFLDVYTSTTAYDGIPGLNPVRLSNPDFSWESNRKLEATIDLGIVNDRITMSATIYQNRSSNQLVGFPLAPTTGFTSIQGNFPAIVENRGIELDISSHIAQNRNCNWTLAINFTVPRNELIDFPDLESFSSYPNRYQIGEPLTIKKTYRYLGIDPSIGVYQFEDVNGDDRYNQTDRVVIKQSGTKFFGGISNSFQFKGVQLDFLFQYVNQTQNSYLSFFGAPGFFFNQPSLVMARWQVEGDQADIQKFSVAPSTSQAYVRLISSERSVVDGSFLRLKNVALSYALPKLWLSKLHMEGLKVFLLGQNLLTITDYEGSDPENPGTALPPLRVITAGINLTF